jgi:hypothetical protein
VRTENVKSVKSGPSKNGGAISGLEATGSCKNSKAFPTDNEKRMFRVICKYSNKF